MKTDQKVLCLTAIFLLTLPTQSYSQVENPSHVDSATHSNARMRTSDALLEAVEILGVSQLKGWDLEKSHSTIDITTISDTTTPFLHAQLDGREAYRVLLKAVPVVNSEDTTFRDFEVYLDPVSGHLLKIISTMDTYYKKVASGRIRQASYGKVEEHIRKRRTERIVGFASENPKPTFLKAAEAMPGGIRRADQFIALFVELDYRNSRSPVWVIETWGSWTTISSGGPWQLSRQQGRKVQELQEYKRNYLRSIVDADGKLVVASSY